jgi:type II secretory pathway component PulC
MDVDALVRRVCALAVPALALAVWLLRAEPPAEGGSPITDAPPPSPSSAPGSGSRSAPPGTPSAPGESGVQRFGERALAEPAPAKLAVDLPLADTLPSRPRAPSKRARSPGRASGGACGGLEVRLITASQDPAWAFASIATAADEPARLYRIGERVGSYRVASIEYDRVWVHSSGSRCAVSLHAGLREAVEASGKSPTGPTWSEGDAPPWHVPEPIAEAIEKLSETEYRVTKDVLPALFERGADLFSGMRLQPVEREHEVVGIALDSIPTDSLLERLGVLPGDVLLALGDKRCTSFEATLSALRELRDRQHLVARLERDGTAFDLELEVR